MCSEKKEVSLSNEKRIRESRVIRAISIIGNDSLKVSFEAKVAT